MISAETLASAVERGIISAEQARALEGLAGESAPAEPDEEKLRFIGGFSDIFITIGIALFLGSLGYILSARASPAATCAAIAIASWLIAEYFTRVKRASLPSIVLLVLFATNVFLAVMFGLGGGSQRGPYELDLTRGGAVLPAAVVTVLATALHYWRFRVPITVAVGTAAACGVVLGLLLTFAPAFTQESLRWLILGLGLVVFALAMRFDMSDLTRRTRRTDIAFWLHLLAAPMIVHPLVTGVAGARFGFDPSSAWAILSVFLALGVIAVLIDRRALLVSGLSYAGFALGSLLQTAALSADRIPLTLLALGLFVLLLSAAWRPLRGALLQLLPGGLVRRLPHASSASAS